MVLKRIRAGLRAGGALQQSGVEPSTESNKTLSNSKFRGAAHPMGVQGALGVPRTGPHR